MRQSDVDRVPGTWFKNEEAYRFWRQGDARWNQEEAWPAELFPEAEWRYFREAGCLVSSLAIMLRRFGIEHQSDEALFNPWILNERLIRVGSFSPSADLLIGDIEKLYPLHYAGSRPYSRRALVRLMETGDPFLITVPGDRSAMHFIVPNELTEGDLKIIDPGWGKQRLSEYDTAYELRVFQCDIKLRGSF